VLLAGALGAAIYFARPLRPPRAIAPDVLAPAAGSLACVAVLSTWLVNPFLALLLLPPAHVGLLTPISDRQRRLPATAAGAATALIPVLIASISLAARLGVGPALPWHLLLMLNGGQIGFAEAFFACLIAGAITGSLAIARAPRPPDEGLRFAVRGAGA